ncbi:Protein kinase domain [Dillenia turbinata]|uniref:Protein kinase domain n=1 Tax=Dillenia turbinata TaxID=194707 RepID=A0AAN8UEW9_9MAGN
MKPHSRKLLAHNISFAFQSFTLRNLTLLRDAYLRNGIIGLTRYLAVSNSENNHHKRLALGFGIAGPTFLFVVLATFGYFTMKKWRGIKNPDSFKAEFVSRPGHFTFKKLKAATIGFHSSRIIERGAFGTVYKAFLFPSGTIAAVKRSKHTHESKTEFIAELTIIVLLRHKNLVQLQGWCVEKDELLLVYEFIPNGSLDKVPYQESSQGSGVPRWCHRYNIALGIASVLSYLHQECEQQVIHRDIKTRNRMLDGNFNPRLAPEYLQYGKSTEKTDIFSCGVVILEKKFHQLSLQYIIVSSKSLVLLEMGSSQIVKENSTIVCAILMGQSVEEMVSQMSCAKAQGADMVEIRLDFINNFRPQEHLQIILKNKPLPVIIAYRSKEDGGQYEVEEDARVEALLLAKEFGADYIEYEVKLASQLMTRQKQNQNDCSKIIVSYYVDGETPCKEDLSHLVAHMQSTGADIMKLVVSASDITELATIFHLLAHRQVPLTAYSTGERGLISQILGPKYGGFLIYGCIYENSVPGLPTLDSLRQTYKVNYLDADTRVFGLISKPVSHSKGPILHNPTFRHVGYNGIYVPLFVDDLKEFFSVYSSPDFTGFSLDTLAACFHCSVGIPYKEAIIQYCDEVHSLAQAIGAVNTIIRSSNGKLVGYNTDCEASITAIEDALKDRRYDNAEVHPTSPLNGKQFVVAGAGGAGRALAFGAKSRGARVTVFDIDFDRAKSLASAISGEARPFEGMETFGDYQLVFDSVYTPRKTRLLIEAEAAGAIVVSGVEMFLRQAVAQFQLFTGREAPEEQTRLFEKFSPPQDLETLIKQSPLPTLVTYRPIWEGGQYEGDEHKRQEALRIAMELGADSVDVELQVAHEFNESISGKKPEKFQVIVSSHNFHNTPSLESLGNLVARMQAAGADIVKIATTGLDITDVERIFQIMVHSQIPMIGIVMGERGVISRVLSPKYGAYLTYGAIEAGAISAPGQITAKDLLDLFNFRLIRPDTKINGVMGKPVGHSKSPLLFNVAFKSDGLNAIYVHLLVDDVEKFFNTYSTPDFGGCSCGIPHKEAALKCMDEIDPIAEKIGAINHIVRRQDGTLKGYNTDYVGAIEAIEDALRGSNGASNGSISPLAGRLIVVLGAGGAGKSLAYERAKDLADTIGAQAIRLEEAEHFDPEDNMILANCTSLAMKPHIDGTAMPKHALKRYCLVFDAVYTPKETRLLREAKETGAILVYGTDMLIRQGFEQYRNFTGLQPPEELFRELMEKHA